MLKLQRNYKIVFEIGTRKNFNQYIPEEEVTVAYPTTLQFSVTHSINFSNVSRGSFQLYNLSPAIRSKLWKDLYNQTKYITMYLYAGYQDTMPLIFRGDIGQCYSYRESGSVDFITEIQSGDGTYLLQYGIANCTLTEGTEFENLLKVLLENTPQYKPGYLTKEIPPLPRNTTFLGQTMDILGSAYGDYQIFIDKGELNVLGKNDVIPGDIQVITAESGLLGSPRRAEQYLNCSLIFEPQLKIGQAIELISDSLPFVNNIYKVIGLSHNGVISPVTSGSVITDVQLYMGETFFNELKKATETVYTGTTTEGIWIKPVQGRISGSFHEQRATHLHAGIDIAAPYNTPVYAPANGTIEIAGTIGDYGKCIYMNNGKINSVEVTSRYGHLNQFLVHNSQKVYQGDLIGYVGSTGYSNGPHLHFEVRENGVEVNPLKYIGAYS